MTDTLSKIDFQSIAANERRSLEFREQCYRRMIDSGNRPLLSRATANTKLRKSMVIQYRICSLSLAHASESGHNVCPQSGNCASLCVGGDSIGLAMVWRQIMAGRIAKTQYLFADRQGFLVQLVGEIHREERIAEREGSKLVCRLNTFSDIVWEHKAYGCIPQLFPDAVFYDYTKLSVDRVLSAPANYHLCKSWSENPRHQEQCFDLLMVGKNISVVFGQEGSFTGHRALMQEIPKTFRLLGKEFEVFSGDDTDLRFLDQGPDSRGYGRVCGLAFKSGTLQGRDEGLKSGFVVMQEGGAT